MVQRFRSAIIRLLSLHADPTVLPLAPRELLAARLALVRAVARARQADIPVIGSSWGAGL